MPLLTLPKNLRWPEWRCIIFRPALGNLKNRKKAKIYQLVGIALSINGHTKSPQTEILSQFRDM